VNAPLIIISPCFPPQRGGLADHTVKLAQGLSASREVSVLTSIGGASGDGFRVCPTVRNWKSPKAVLRAVGQLPVEAKILWQYVPHMYGHGGVNPGLAVVMRALRRQGRAQCLIAHEIASALSWRPHWLAYALAHRYQWRHILEHTEGIGISTEAWLEEWCRRAPQTRHKFFLAPSPSNIPVAPVGPDHARGWRQDVGLAEATQVIAYFGTLCRFRQFEWILAAWVQSQAQGRRVGLVAVGDRPAEEVPGELRPLFRPLGYLPAAEVSAALQAVDVLALPFADGVAERRTTFMAGLSHGCAILTTLGPSTGATLRHREFFQGVEADRKEEFVEQLRELLCQDVLRRKLGQAARQAYAQRYDWPKLIETVEEKLARMRRHEPS
jgi:glycosyltransferase involved in cell wall biosynthesis